jgi:uncharacterized membrane protein
MRHPLGFRVPAG